MDRPPAPERPLPRQWPEHVKSAVLHAVSLASMVFGSVCGSVSKRHDKILRLRVELERVISEIALLKEEMRIKDERLGRIPPKKRPYYTPIERMLILKLKAARCWSSRQAAKAFLSRGRSRRRMMAGLSKLN